MELRDGIIKPRQLFSIQKLTLHWSNLAAFLLGPDCIGPFVGTQTRRQHLTALPKLIAAVTSTGRTENVVPHHVKRKSLSNFGPVILSILASPCLEQQNIGRNNAG
jgi:hypothetical protein